ncbi:MAG: hypothetical protein QOE90_1335 [Thermoplasmata archaeon]|jgi:hypothetical protein|nr:hypothetical protein [Thermoplasmata archaeon]
MRALPLALLATLLLAGCVGNSSPTSPAPHPAPVAPAPAPAHASAPPPPSLPSAFFVSDAGPIQGPFARSWPLKVAAVGFRDALVDFNLSGAQPGLPATARLHLSLQDAKGHEIKGEDLGLGADAAARWVLSARDLPLPGDYVLKATSAPGEAALPSGGAGTFALFAAVTY